MYPVTRRPISPPVSVSHRIVRCTGKTAVGAEARVMGGGGLRPGKRAHLRGALTGQPPHRILHHHTEPPAGSPERSGGNPNGLGARFDVLRICRQVPPKEVFGHVHRAALLSLEWAADFEVILGPGGEPFPGPFRCPKLDLVAVPSSGWDG